MKSTNLESALRALAEETSRAEASPEVRDNLLAALSAQRKARRPAWQLWGFRLWPVAATACLFAGFWLGSGRRDPVSGKPGLADVATVELNAGPSPATDFSVPDSQAQRELEPADAGSRSAPAAVSLPARESTVAVAAVTPWYFHSGLPAPATGRVIRMEVSAATAQQFGVYVAGKTADAEILMGDDGLARAIRFLRPVRKSPVYRASSRQE